MKHSKKQRYFIVATFFVLMSMSAVITGFLTARNESGQAQSESNSSTVTSIDLFESSVSKDTIVLEVGQTVQVNNKSSYLRELSLGSGNAGHAPENSEEAQEDYLEERESDTHEDKSHKQEESKHAHDHTDGFSSRLFGPDEAWKATFQEPGTYFLHDHANPEVNILVVVYEKTN